MNYRHVNLSAFPQFNPALKLGWAKRHLDRLNLAIDNFLRGETCSVRAEDHSESGEYVLYFTPTPLDAELGLIAGDFLCCLRSSLDHLACALTLTKNGLRNDSASFPVIGINNTKGRKSFSDATRGIPREAKETMGLLQPYHSKGGYKAAKLWRLHRLWNIDKHRRIPLHGTFAQIPVRYPTRFPPITDGLGAAGMMRFPLIAKPYVDWDSFAKVEIFFGDEAEEIIVPAQELGEMHSFVRNSVFPHFLKHFEQPKNVGSDLPIPV